MKKQNTGDGPVIIKKYANRRLYNTETSSYITLEHLAAMTREPRLQGRRRQERRGYHPQYPYPDHHGGRIARADYAPGELPAPAYRDVRRFDAADGARLSRRRRWTASAATTNNSSRRSRAPSPIRPSPRSRQAQHGDVRGGHAGVQARRAAPDGEAGETPAASKDEEIATLKAGNSAGFTRRSKARQLSRMPTVPLIGAGATLALALYAGLGDRRRRKRRANLDSIGLVDWPTIQVLALIATAITAASPPVDENPRSDRRPGAVAAACGPNFHCPAPAVLPRASRWRAGTTPRRPSKIRSPARQPARVSQPTFHDVKHDQSPSRLDQQSAGRFFIGAASASGPGLRIMCLAPRVEQHMITF